MGLLGRIYLLVALAVVPGFALLGYIHYQNYQRHQAAVEAEALRSARLVAAELQQILESMGLVLATAGAAPAVTSLQEPGCSAFLRQVQGRIPSAAVIAVAGADGALRCGGAPRVSIGDRPYFQEALRSEVPVVGNYTIARTTGVPVLPVALRIRTPQGPAVIVIGLRLASLREHFLRLHPEFPPGSSITVADRNGIILVRLPNVEREGSPLSRYRFIAESETGGTFRSTAEETADGVARFVGFTSTQEPPAIGLAVAVGLPQAPILAELRAQALANYLLLGLIALLTFVAAVLGGRLFIHRPVAHLLAVIGAWRSGNRAARAEEQGLPRQFAQIGKAFNEMAVELEAAMQHKDMLLRELNHRVMNSLATIAALLKWESRDMPDAESRQRFESAVSRMEALALVYKRMQSIDGVEAVDFTAFLHDLCGDLETSIMEAGTACVVEADALQLPPAQATSLTLIVNELVTNALKHGAPQAGPVRVTLRRTDGACRLTVRNPGSLPANYTPGHTAGFGMRMVATLARQIKGELKAATTAGETEFAVTFTPAIPQAGLARSSDAGEAAETDEDRPRAVHPAA